MKGFTLQIKEQKISGALREGITSITITHNEDGSCRINFGSLDEQGMSSYTWHSSDLHLNDCLSIIFENINSVSEIQETLDYSDSQQTNKIALDTYYKLKKELEDEGII